MKIAGLDIGTTGCKMTVFDGRGTALGRAYRDYPQSGAADVREVDAQDILKGVFSVMKEMGARYPDIAGIGVTSFGESFVMTDEAGTPLHKAMLYTDPRGARECGELTEAFGEMRLAGVTGLRPHEMYSLPKMMWLKRHRPEIYRRAKHIFLMEDFVVFALTGTARIDYSLAARTMGFDIRTLSFHPEIFERAGIDMGLMSKPVPSGTPAGALRKEIAAETGLSGTTQVVSISHDQVAAAIGAGVFEPDTAVDGAGTVECITPVFSGLPDHEVMYRGGYAVVPYVIPGKYLCYAFSYTGGALIQWCADTLAKKEKEIAGERGISVNELLEEGCQKPTGLLVLPHFAGAATPYMDMGSKGAVLGLTAASTVSDIYQACMEGVVYEMLLNLECMGDSAANIRMLRATGGGARSKVWMQMKADVLNLPVAALGTMDAGTVGSAMLTGIAAGCFADLKDAAGHMVKLREIYRPRPELREPYRKQYEKYKGLYQAVRPFM